VHRPSPATRCRVGFDTVMFTRVVLRSCGSLD
jgi:hypothetical protein